MGAWHEREHEWIDTAKIRDFTTITQQEIHMAMERLNNRPRKRLGYQTPSQVFFKSGVALHI
jgi:IS30 family transposase